MRSFTVVSFLALAATCAVAVPTPDSSDSSDPNWTFGGAQTSWDIDYNLEKASYRRCDQLDGNTNEGWDLAADDKSWQTRMGGWLLSAYESNGYDTAKCYGGLQALFSRMTLEPESYDKTMDPNPQHVNITPEATHIYYYPFFAKYEVDGQIVSQYRIDWYY